MCYAPGYINRAFKETINYSETKLGANNNEGKTTLWAPINYQSNSKL